jgi:hypothetical protein
LSERYRLKWTQNATLKDRESDGATPCDGSEVGCSARDA